MAKKYYWLKLQKDFFKRHDIRVLEEQENGKEYVLFYLKLLLESVSHEGHLRFNDTIPYDEKMLAVITNTNIDIVRSAIKIFQALNLMEILDDQTIYMNETYKMVGAESRQAEIMRKNREEEKVIKKLAKQEETHIPYIENYTNNKRYGGNYYVVFQRDGKQCVSCGSKQNLCVHHIIGYDENNPITTQRNNLITLCRTCHSKEHALPTSIITKEMLKEIKFDFDLYNEIYKISNCVGNGNNVTPMLQKSYIEKEKELDKEIDIEIEPKVDKKKITKKEKPPKTAYGEFGNVKLTDEEFEKLKKWFLLYYEAYIEKMDLYIASKGVKYKSHYATLRQWLNSDGKVPEEISIAEFDEEGNLINE